jgi:hypothetical protein
MIANAPRGFGSELDGHEGRRSTVDRGKIHPSLEFGGPFGSRRCKSRRAAMDAP